MDELELPRLEANTVEKGEVWTITLYRDHRYSATNTGPTTYGENLVSYPQAASTSTQLNFPKATVILSPFETKAIGFSFTENPSNPSKWFMQLTPQFVLEPQEEGGFVAYSSEYSGAVGQGETEEEAMEDLQEAILSLKEFLQEQKGKTQN
jgi:predicted RNase H-like HicB family nuclease